MLGLGVVGWGRFLMYDMGFYLSRDGLLSKWQGVQHIYIPGIASLGCKAYIPRLMYDFSHGESSPPTPLLVEDVDF